MKIDDFKENILIPFYQPLCNKACSGDNEVYFDNNCEFVCYGQIYNTLTDIDESYTITLKKFFNKEVKDSQNKVIEDLRSFIENEITKTKDEMKKLKLLWIKLYLVILDKVKHNDNKEIYQGFRDSYNDALKKPTNYLKGSNSNETKGKNDKSWIRNTQEREN